MDYMYFKFRDFFYKLDTCAFERGLDDYFRPLR